MFMSVHQKAGRNRNTKTANIAFRKCGRVQIFGRGCNKYKFHSQRT